MSKARYSISKDKEFVIENYNSAPPFASFFPGIAGIFGCPMWVFYCNRGQAITSAGVHDKDGAIIEFRSANKAYRLASLQGFRTFIKVNGKFYEPFSERTDYPRSMHIAAHGLKLEETNSKLKIKVEVNYFTLANEQFPGLARNLKITNLAGKPIKLEVIDGLPAIVPFGFVNDLLKRLSNTIAAWSVVENLDHNAPFYKLKVAPADISETQVIENGNFFACFAHLGDKTSPASIIVDPAVVFGSMESLEEPANFLAAKKFKLPAKQQTSGFMPAALAYQDASLKKGQALELSSLIGQIDSLTQLNRARQRLASKAYWDRKTAENKALINQICSSMATQSSAKHFDLYAGQTFLDNTMRGGLPINIGNKVLYLYYRKHGDMERDYNDFKLMPAYFSQGNGNYRDINQNRRNDIFFNPKVGEENIKKFFNLIQLDGFNPLVVLGSQFYVNSAGSAAELIKKHLNNPSHDLALALTKPFVLGLLLKRMEAAGLSFKTSREEFATDLLAKSVIKDDAIHGEGYWTDHFSYNTDLLQSYEAIYPEKIKDILFNKKIFTFYDNDHVVVERNIKYRLVGDKVRQYGSVKADTAKAALLSGRSRDRKLMRVKQGKGKVYQTTLLVKLLCLAANRAASFDPEGIGLEMEADKPDWYDALNGLPGLFGSSLSETLELKRICAYFLDHLGKGVSANLPIEIKELMDKISAELNNFFNTNDAFKYWDIAYQLKEDYRRQTKLGISGEEVVISGEEAAEFLSLAIKKCDDAVRRCLDKYKNYCTYFINEVVEHELINGNSVRAKKFQQRPLPLFLEGFVHALKVEKDKQVYQRVKQSGLFDRKLQMYKVNASLADTPIEIGRARIFTPGWLENESVWLHMEYKYLLELLKAGMYDEFFNDFQHVLIPFQDPRRYKRSILENSSFIVSSAHPNQENHGRGFVARLSGASAEFIDIWLIMMTGKRIFSLDNKGSLRFELKPVLPGWLFDKKGQLSFKLLGSIDVAYLNPSKKNTYDGLKPVSYKLVLKNKEVSIDKPFISEPYAGQIRDKKVSKIVVTLG